MSFLALAILFISACMHATWNYLAKQSQGGNLFVAFYMFISFLWVTPVALWNISTEGFTLTWPAGAFIVGSILLHVVYSLSLQYGYKIGDLSLLYPVARGTGPFMVAFLAMFFYGERLTWLSGTGILLIIVSIFILSGGLRVFYQKGIKVTVLYGMYVGIIIAGYTLVDKGAVTVAAMSPVVFYYFVLIGQFFVLMPYVWRWRKETKTEWRKNKYYIVGVGVLNPLAYMLVLLVMTFIPVSHVAPVREMSILIGTLMGTKLLSESTSLVRPIGAGLMLLGVALVAIS
ncbi:MAG TPA: EamA family transporter [Pseudogracilibacillus sp.]|nr:EamA family transporter [Pseudogracilibacillus sp.]